MADLKNIDDATLQAAARYHGIAAPETMPASAPATSPANLSQVDDDTLAKAAAFHGIQIPEADFGARAGSYIMAAAANAATGIRNAWTGEGARDEDLPELPRDVASTYREGQGILGSKMSLARGDLGKLGIYRQYFPDDQAEIDQHGNVIVSRDGQRYFLNRPGFSGQDVQDIGTAALIEAPLASAGGRALGGLGLLGRSIGTGAGVATGSVAQDLAARGAGSQEPIDLPTAAIAGLTGGAFEFAAPMLKPFFKRFLGQPAMFKNGTVTSPGRKVLSRLGIDVNDVTPEFARNFQDLARDAATPDDLASAARRAQAGEYGVRLSRGDASGSVVQQGREDVMLKGGYGEAAADTLRGFRENQADDILRARGGLLEGQQGLFPHEGTRAALDALETESTGLKAAVRGAYDTAGEMRASVLKDGVKDLARNVKRGFQKFNPGTAPKAAKLVKSLDGFEKRFPGRVKAVNVKALEDLRQQISALARSNDTVEAAAAKNIRQSFDDFMAGALDDAMIRGDAEALDAFKNARALRAEYAHKFEADGIVAKMMELEPSEATRYLFGASKLGGKNGTTKAIRHLKEVLGPDSPEWAALREEAFMRLFPDDRAAIGKFPGAFGKARLESPELMNELFTTAELKKLGQFADVVRMATQRQPGAVNTSNSATTLARIAQDVFGANSGNIIRSLGNLIPQSVRDAAGAAKAGGMIRPEPARSIVPPGITGALGAQLTGQREPDDPKGRLARALMQKQPMTMDTPKGRLARKLMERR